VRERREEKRRKRKWRYGFWNNPEKVGWLKK
jgi:hypothetical protein